MRKKSGSSTGWRFALVFFALFCIAAIAVGRLAFLQIADHGYYKALAQGQQNRQMFSKGERGAVFVQDKNGALYVLAANQQIPFAFVSPAEIQNREETAAKLAEILLLEKSAVALKLENEQSFFELIKKPITEDQTRRIRALALPGVYVGSEQARVYPHARLASHTVGFVNQDGNGQYGIEENYNDELEGKEGTKAGSKNPAAHFLAAFASASKNGRDLVLTLDYNIQSLAESLLEKAESQLGVEGGTIIVMDPSTGKLLALANAPSFDPNSYSKVEDLSIFQNPAIQKIYEPGSVFKAITMAAALDAEAVQPHTTYQDEGAVRIGAKTITNYDTRTWGQRTMTEVLEYSINTGAVFAERQLGHEKFLEYISAFGFFEPARVDLAGEVFSTNAEFKKGYEINFATASFGQGIEITPLQLVQAFSALANNGVMVRPSIAQSQQKAQKQVISSKTAAQITEMLASVVQNGFAKSAQIPGYAIAGKTGTAQVSWSALGIGKSGYSDKTVQSFIGYAPAFNPKFLMLVKLDNPATKTAEYSAVPIFRELAKYILDYYQIPPDYDI